MRRKPALTPRNRRADVDDRRRRALLDLVSGVRNRGRQSPRATRRRHASARASGRQCRRYRRRDPGSRRRATEILDLSVDHGQRQIDAPERARERNAGDERADAHEQYAETNTDRPSTSDVPRLPMHPSRCRLPLHDSAVIRRERVPEPDRSLPRSSLLPAKTGSTPGASADRCRSAAMTWLGSRAPEVHALPAETAMPSRSSASTVLRNRAPANETLLLFGKRGAPAPLTRTSGMRADARLQAVAQAADALSALRSFPQRRARAPQPADDAGDVFGPRAPPELLAAAVHDRLRAATPSRT